MAIEETPAKPVPKGTLPSNFTAYKVKKWRFSSIYCKKISHGSMGAHI